ncbi:6-hydroxymethylpterin diphosphokinase MptE-like protein [Halosimplex salinum]|uniref:6-hydroxymethylpterin diphosphokinase MptE-like protein n=1 Tax=Halosimplex salinum TaxID=1710538 RepID=UPI000F470A5E|nr:6-hydroxymethylpterin diphosphokinase MptE-like protein [Halosimplex salinum]
MEFHDWEPVYAAILADMGFDRAADERARDLLAGLVSDSDIAGDSGATDGARASDAPDESDPAGEDRGPRTLAPADVDFDGETVAVAGAGPSLDAELDRVERADGVVAASDAATRLRDAGLSVDCMVTDLDEESDVARELTEAGTPVAVHAHGDNQPALRERVPRLRVEWVLPTTQAAPVDAVFNTGGFTDGDRAAFLADHCGASELVFAGWDFDDPDVDRMKARKLVWAERLLRWLERRRGERFAVLDGRRDGIDESALPV